jgi:hypothetical protein
MPSCQIGFSERSADLAAALGNVARAVSTGELTPEEAQAVGAVLEVQRKAIELAELESRVTALEGRLGGSAA